MALASGTKLGPYEIVAPLGAGGMAEVYRARDARLERDVAIKVLPANQTSDPSLRQRLEREAKAVSKLTHPHICALYDIGRQDHIDFIVMELVEGETLEQRLMKGPLPTEQTLRYATQIADALAKAHKGGFTHRDLKPSNVMLTRSGAKLMDFGLAKQTGPGSLLTAVNGATLEQTKLTGEGTIVGTVQYMAPEQLEGREADARTDIFALGEIVYEMATGRSPFVGKSRATIIAAILSSEPSPMADLQPMTPPALERVVRKCLAKDPDERWQSANDLASELSWIAESGVQTSAVASPARETRERVAWAICALLALALVGGAIWLRGGAAQQPSLYFSAPFTFPARDLAISPNGHSIAVVGYLESARRNVIWIYELGSNAARSLSATQGASYPFWSADGQYLAFFADGKLKKVDVAGGQVQTICDAPTGRGGTWNHEDTIVFTPDGVLGAGLYRVPAVGGTPTPITSPDASRGEQSHRWPMFLPDGKHFLYMASNFSGEQHSNAIFVGSLDSSEKRFIVEASANAAYAAPGYLLFCREKTLLAQRFDVKQLTLTGQPTAVLTDVQYQPQVRRAVFATSDNGLLVAQTGSQVALSLPTWFDRKGNEIGAVGKPDVYGNVSMAPDEKRVAVDKTDMGSQNTDIWIYEGQRDDARRFTFDPTLDVTPVWSPDASRLVFTSNAGRGTDLFMKDSTGTQEAKLLVHNDFNKFPSDWSKDGRYILFSEAKDLWLYSLQEMKSMLFLKALSVVKSGRFSPDGRWVAYASNETGKWEIYVTSFPDARGKWHVSTGGVEQPRWRGDGKELFYLSSDGKIVAVPVTSGTTFDGGTPVTLFEATPRQPVSLNDQLLYDVSRDGQRFLINTQIKQAETAAMSVVLNWPAKMNK